MSEQLMSEQLATVLAEVQRREIAELVERWKRDGVGHRLHEHILLLDARVHTVEAELAALRAQVEALEANNAAVARSLDVVSEALSWFDHSGVWFRQRTNAEIQQLRERAKAALQPQTEGVSG